MLFARQFIFSDLQIEHDEPDDNNIKELNKLLCQDMVQERYKIR